MKKYFAYVTMLASLVLFSHSATAGSVDGPNIFWFNISNNRSNFVDSQVKKYINSGDDFCWNSGAVMYMQGHPPELTEELAKAALIEKSRKAQTALTSILKKRFNKTPGFDGVIAYTDTPKPQFISISSKGKIKRDFITDISDLDAIKVSLCIVMPAISREP